MGSLRSLWLPVLLAGACAGGELEGREEAAAERAGSGSASGSGSDSGWTRELSLASGAFDVGRAPSVVVHAPPGFDGAGRPLRLVVFLHGWSCCARRLWGSGEVACRDGGRPGEGWGLGARFAAAAPDALLVIPQLAFLTRDGGAGRFARRGGFRRFVREMLDALEGELGPVALDDLSPITLLAHSAGYETALAVIARGEIPVRHLVLFDALYRGVEPFVQWAGEDSARRLVSLHTGAGRTARQSTRLARRSRRLLGDDALWDHGDGEPADALADHRVVVGRTSVPHGRVPAHHLRALLEALIPGTTGPGGRPSRLQSAP
ncbi:MAG TPA: hypothetical protein RMH99_27480 [Sandaracinaceae bacterium LLY-WYZ-13_1]|nr:hypothetical protein [Sandaracinaceae bacterium LLY-WYZ-13_1]